MEKTLNNVKAAVMRLLTAMLCREYGLDPLADGFSIRAGAGVLPSGALRRAAPANAPPVKNRRAPCKNSPARLIWRKSGKAVDRSV